MTSIMNSVFLHHRILVHGVGYRGVMLLALGCKKRSGHYLPQKMGGGIYSNFYVSQKGDIGNNYMSFSGRKGVFGLYQMKMG